MTPTMAAARGALASVHTLEAVEAAAAVVRVHCDIPPEIAIVLGTGLGGLANEIDVEASVSYAKIPGFPLSTVESHAGRLLIGTLGGKKVVAMQGRFHRYEGYTLQQVTFPVRVLHALGAQTLIVSNACGGMNPWWQAGDLMLIGDHINFLGDNPLIGANDDRLGARFPDMSAPYDESLRELARAVAAEQRTVLREGVYVAVSGPNLETRAEYRMLRALGADVVGMSTVPEAIVARQCGLNVAAVSCVTNPAAGIGQTRLSHAEVLATAERVKKSGAALLRNFAELYGKV